MKSRSIRTIVLTSTSLALVVLAAACGLKRVSGEQRVSTFRVTVLDVATQTPISGARVRVEREGGGFLPLASSDTDGEVIWSTSPGEKGKVTVTDPRGEYLEGSVEIVRQPECVVALQRGARVRLRITAEGPLENCVLDVWTADRAAGVRWRAVPLSGSDAGDSAAIADLAPLAAGPAKIFVSAPGFVTRVLDVNIPTGGGDLGEVHLACGGAVLRGRFPSSLRVRPTEVFLRFSGAGLRVPVEDRSFRFEGLPPNLFATLIVKSGDRELFSREIVVDELDSDLGEVRPLN
jgi:hypothetical protein